MRRFILVVLMIVGFSISTAAQPRKDRAITEREVKAVVQAIEDEIYDYSYQGKFSDVGTPDVHSKRTAVPVYFKPSLTDGEGWVIYKLLPYGEVIRSFFIGKDGTAVLEGDPEIGFPPSQPNMLTIYMKDAQVCRLRRSWLQRHFEVVFLPSPQRIREASVRQKKRIGFSAQDAN